MKAKGDTPASPEEVLARLIRENPGKSERQLLEIFKKEVYENEELERAITRSAFEEWLKELKAELRAKLS